MPEEFRASEHSLLSFIAKRFARAPRTLLREHYRCHPDIIGFCNEKFYNGELIVLTERKGDMPLHVIRTVPGNHARDHLNRREIDVIAEEVVPRFRLAEEPESAGIVTPYRAQADAMQKEAALCGITADTVDKFQGRERSTIILSTVDNDISDFADDARRLNVAVSRAVDRLVIVTSGNTPSRRTCIGDLISYVDYHGMEIADSRVCSVFDLLYSQHAKARRAALARMRKISPMDSENLMFDLIGTVLKEEGLDGYGVHALVPLYLLVRDSVSLLRTERERSYVLNRLTHVDFLVFEKISRRIVAAVEVDGWAFHQCDAQKERDELKDAICRRCGIPLFRFSTTGSGEKEKIRGFLLSFATRESGEAA
ncbi:MAG: AAA domain-containing protein [Mailhella sp.]|nr:AAA domain-containing protein [Mailhella sp.]